jgi:hypothetical protein
MNARGPEAINAPSSSSITLLIELCNSLAALPNPEKAKIRKPKQ